MSFYTEVRQDSKRSREARNASVARRNRKRDKSYGVGVALDTERILDELKAEFDSKLDNVPQGW